MKEKIGYIKLSRKLLDNPIFKKPAYLAVWIYLLLNAQHKETFFIWNNKKQTLKKGQLLTGLKTISKKTGVAQGTVYRILKYLENEKQIEQQKTTKFTVITIVNWDRYQGNGNQNEKQIENRLKTDEKQIETYKNVNKNVNKNIPKGIGNTKPKENTISFKEKSGLQAHGNVEINECMEYLKDKLGASLDGSVKENRMYCYNLLRKMKKDYPDVQPVAQIKMLIDVAMQDKFHRKNVTGFKYLYYNTQRIAQSFKSDYGIGDNNSDIQVI